MTPQGLFALAFRGLCISAPDFLPLRGPSLPRSSLRRPSALSKLVKSSPFKKAPAFLPRCLCWGFQFLLGLLSFSLLSFLKGIAQAWLLSGSNPWLPYPHGSLSPWNPAAPICSFHVVFRCQRELLLSSFAVTRNYLCCKSLEGRDRILYSLKTGSFLALIK